MKNTLCLINRLVAAFGVGVLVASVCSPERLLMITVLVLIVLTLGCSTVIRG